MAKIMIGPTGSKADKAYAEFHERVYGRKPGHPTTEAEAETCKHISVVYGFLNKFIHILSHRALVHDRSKLESPEKEVFDEYTEKLRGMTYGSEEYKACLAEMKPALDHHYSANSHHPEHKPNGIAGMSLLDIVEAFCDWAAAAKRHADGNIMNSIEINRKRFGMDPQLSLIFINTVEEIRRLYPGEI
jgi:hypothetical protein